MTDLTPPPVTRRAPSAPPFAFAPRPRATRCECQRCGVHTFPVLRHTVTARCHNCGSDDLVPVRLVPAHV